jgi:hypothetical protein
MPRPPDRVNVAMEGDSWFRLPQLPAPLPIVGGTNYDVERGLLALGYRTWNNAHWGDTIEDMVAYANLDSGYLRVLTDWTPHVFMIGGGGNDLLGSRAGGMGRLVEFLNPHRSGEAMTPSQYLNSSVYNPAVSRVIGFYRFIVEDVLSRPRLRRIKILVHGYDYVRPWGLAWIEQPFRFRGVPDDLRDAVIRLAIDRFNRELSAFADEYEGQVFYVNLRNTVGERWHDELHPTKAGFDAVCAKFHARIQSIL